MTEIQRFHPNDRMCEMSVYNGIAYLAGQVSDCAEDAYLQTQDVLDIIDRLLAEAGSHKSRILRAQIFLSDIADFAAMNKAWEEWVDSQNPPARATVEAKLASPQWKVEIVITAAV